MLSRETAERSFDFGVGCKFAAPCLSQAFEDVGEMSRIDRFGLRFGLHEEQ